MRRARNGAAGRGEYRPNRSTPSSLAAVSAMSRQVRAATLWFAAFLGLIALPFVARWIAARKRPASG